MNEFQRAFRIGDRSFNRLGIYTVQSFDGDDMVVRYDDGRVKRLRNFEMQMRIIDNMLFEQNADLEERDWQRGYTDDEEDVETLVNSAEALLLPQLADLIENRSEYLILQKAFQESSGDCSVYTILLSKLSQQLRWGFHAAGREGMPCIYVGQSWHAPDIRFEKHKAGEHSSYFVHRFGLGLLRTIHEPFSSLSRDTALAAEAALADALGELGCTVFGGH